MRKETQAIAEAFKAGRACTKARTHTDGQAVYLHGNKVAEWRENRTVIAVSLAGWNTVTTRDRVNGVLAYCSTVPARVSCRDHTPFLHVLGERREMDSREWLELPANA